MNAPSPRQPSVCVPLAMSAAGAAMVVMHAARFGVVPAADEGTAAHVFQLLMVAQAPFALHLGVRWLPRAPVRTLGWLALQAAAALVACTAVALLT